jgi:hypothetical protein
MRKGDGGKDTIKVGSKDLPTITFSGFGLSLSTLEEYVKEKSKGKVIIDLRKIGGSRLTIKAKRARSEWRSAVRFVN